MGKLRDLRFLLAAQLPKRWFPWEVLGLSIMLTPIIGLVSWAAVTAQYADSPPQCYGLGFGCSPSPSSSGLLLAFLWLVPVSVVTVLLAITEFFWKKVAVLRSIVLLLFLGLGLALVSLLIGSSVWYLF